MIGLATARVHSAVSSADHRPVAIGPGLWSTFWQDFCPEGEPHERCFVPGDGRAALDRHWAQFASSLVRGARVLDLGCGAGIVGRMLIGHRDDVHVTGVDWAKVPHETHARLDIRTEVRMETLPFADRSFDAAVSLFGIEYGDDGSAMREAARVLKPGAPFSFMIHHRDSEIVREGVVRRQALHELMFGELESAFLAADARGVREESRRLMARFGAVAIVRLMTNHLIVTLNAPPEERQRKWQGLSDGLLPEIALLDHLNQCAKSPEELAAWLAPCLSTAEEVGVTRARRSSGQPIAWHVHGIR